MTANQPWTVARLLDWTGKFLAEKGSESPRLDTEVLLAHTLKCKRIELYTRHDEEVSDEGRQRFKGLIRQRIEGCPVAYLVGRKEFYSLEFEVNRSVLIPRPDTETVVDECLQLAKEMAEPSVIDVGTGSGCLAVAVTKYCKQVRVTAIDVSDEALEVAARNATKHGVAERIRFLKGDLFSPLSAGEQFDFVLSNPPYIPRKDIAGLAAGVRDYEPHTALDGGSNGLEVLDRLVTESPARLKPGGYLIVEIGSPQERPARERIQAQSGFELAKTVYDSAGHPRVLRARWLARV
jgi:release factor glutamine methyltransferase